MLGQHIVAALNDEPNPSMRQNTGFIVRTVVSFVRNDQCARRQGIGQFMHRC